MLEHNVFGVQRNQVDIAKASPYQVGKKVELGKGGDAMAQDKRQIEVTFRMCSSSGC